MEGTYLKGIWREKEPVSKEQNIDDVTENLIEKSYGEGVSKEKKFPGKINYNEWRLTWTEKLCLGDHLWSMREQILWYRTQRVRPWHANKAEEENQKN